MNIIKRNWLAFFGIFLGILGIISSYYFYSLSIKKKDIFFMQSKNFLFLTSPQNKSSQLFSLVRKSDMTEIKDNIYISHFVFWNNGDFSIKKSHVLENLKIKYQSDVEIIDVKITTATRNKIINVKYKFSKNTIFIDFDIMEPEDGFKLQVIYAAEKANKAHLVGTIEGIKNFSSIKKLKKDNIISSIFILLFKASLWIGGAFSLFYCFHLITGLIKKIFRNKVEMINKYVSSIFSYSYWIVIIIVIMFLAYSAVSSTAEEEVRNSIPEMEELIKK